MRSFIIATSVMSTVLLSGCGSVLYLPSDSVYEDVEVANSEDLLAQIVVSVDYCDDLTIEGTLSNNATSDAAVDVVIGLDDGMEPAELTSTVAVAAGATTPFSLDNTTGINPFMGCSATVAVAEIVPSG
jgi:hypothetical protein